MSDNLRVLMLSTDYLPRIGGVANHVHQLSRALIRGGVDVTVLNPVASESTRDATALRYEEDGVPVIRAPWLPATTKASDILARLRSCLRATSHTGPFHVVHQHDYRASVLQAQVLSRRSRAAFVFTNHTSDFLANARQRRQALMDRLAWTGVDALIAPSAELADITSEVFGKPAVRIPNGVALDGFQFRAHEPSDEDFVVLCPRRMDPKNGVEFLAQALHQLPRPAQHRAWRFVFTGDADAPNIDAEYAARVRRIVAEVPDHVSVVFAGNVPPNRMPNLYEASHVVVMPSLVEAISLSALEAMAVGAAVIATEVGGLAELISNERTGLLVPPRDPHAIAAALTRMEANDRLRLALARDARQEVERDYSWDEVATRTADVYRSAIQRHSTPRRS